MSEQDLTQQSERLKALWKSGRDKYTSFFSVLNEVRSVVGDDALPNWCFDNLRIGISVIVNAGKLLTALDREIVQSDLAAAKKAERDSRLTKAMDKQKEKEKENKRIHKETRLPKARKFPHETRVAVAKAYLDERKSKKQIGEEFGVNHWCVEVFVAEERGRREGRAGL